jgi:hypothetical protein
MIKKNIGFIVDDENIDYLSFELINWAIKSKKFSKIYILKLSGNFKEKIYKPIYKRSISSLLATFIFKSINRFEKFFIQKRYKKHFKNYEIPTSKKIFKIKIYPEIKKNLFTYYFSPKDINIIKKKKIDVLIRLCSGILRGKILNSTPFGVISCHHGDPHEFRGGPAGFWEVYKKIPNSYFIIQKLSNELDNGDILLKGSIQTKHYYLLNQILLKEKSLFFFQNYILKILDKKVLKLNDNLPYFKQFYTYPGLNICLNYIIKTYFNITLKKLFNKEKLFSIYYQNKNWKKISLRNCKKITSNFYSYADPFVMEYKSGKYIFYERFDKRKFGEIGVYEASNQKDLGLINFQGDSKSHKSFPYVFKHNKKIYMIPETHKLSQIRLYESVQFPLKWKLRKILIKNIRAVDSMIIQKNNFFWLFTNICSSNLNDFSSELHIYYSNNLISDNWKPHTKNPVIFDGQIGRNAGLILDKSYYRVSQTHNFLDYGSKININKIIKLDKNSYKEINYFESKNFENNKFINVHHLNYLNNFSVFDYKSE